MIIFFYYGTCLQCQKAFEIKRKSTIHGPPSFLSRNFICYLGFSHWTGWSAAISSTRPAFCWLVGKGKDSPFLVRNSFSLIDLLFGLKWLALIWLWVDDNHLREDVSDWQVVGERFCELPSYSAWTMDMVRRFVKGFGSEQHLGMKISFSGKYYRNGVISSSEEELRMFCPGCFP